MTELRSDDAWPMSRRSFLQVCLFGVGLSLGDMLQPEAGAAGESPIWRIVLRGAKGKILRRFGLNVTESGEDEFARGTLAEMLRLANRTNAFLKWLESLSEEEFERYVNGLDGQATDAESPPENPI